jgi:hypothetical protein
MTCVQMVQELLRLCIQLEFHQVDNLYVADDLANHLASEFWLNQDVHQKLFRTCPMFPVRANCFRPKLQLVMEDADQNLER